MPEVVFRSTHPDVLSVLADYKATVGEWHEQVAVLLADLGFDGRDFLIASGLGSRWITGIEPLPDEEPPSGWRIAHRSDQDVLVPDKRRKVGKDADARIQQTQPPADVRGHLPGMPGTQWAGSTIYTPALCEIDGAVWVRWREDVSRVDEALWEQVPLSQYWAARDLDAIETRTQAASPGPWERGFVWLTAGLAFDDNQNHVAVKRATHCAYCHLGEPEWSGRTDINGTVMRAHRHRHPEPWNTESGVSGANGFIVAAEVLDPNDTEFIVHARTDVPAMAAEIRRLERLLDEANCRLAGLEDQAGVQ